MAETASNVVLAVLVVVLGILLIIRQRQLKKAKPLKNLEQVLESLRQNIIENRIDGKIQKVASHLSDILIDNLETDRILFFRKQRRIMEMNYVYGLKNVQRAKYRIKVTNDLLKRLLDGRLLGDPSEISGMINKDLARLLEEGKFNIVFPVFWRDNLYGVYFISTRLAIDHPLIKTFLLFLNQNLSIAYHLTRLESSRQILEGKVENQRQKVKKLEEHYRRAEGKAPEDDPGHLIEMFGHRRVEELVTDLFDRVRAGLKAEKLIFVARPNQDGEIRFQYSLGIAGEEFTLDTGEFQKILGSLHKRRVYGLEDIKDVITDGRLREQLEREDMKHLSQFSLSESEPGLLFWTGKNADEKGETRFLNRLEQVARRAIVNARAFQRVEAMSNTDSLTGLNNHRYFVRRLHEEIQRAKRYRRTVGLLLFDIDDFKLYNDKYGHQWGDRLLRQMGRMLTRSLRSMDIVARYGGDEFGIIMPEAGKSTCGVFMDRLRDSIASANFPDRPDEFAGHITISVGSAVFPDDAGEPERLIYCADMALLRSKALGRNRSTIFEAELIEQNSGLDS